MNLDELNAIGEVARQKVAREGGSIAAMTRAHTRAIVEAIRDEVLHQRGLIAFSEILEGED